MQHPTVNTALQSAAAQLAAAGCDTPRLDAEVLLAHTLNTNRTWLITHANSRLLSDQQRAFIEQLERRRQREPVAYIVGHKEFFALNFVVSPAVLIPRPETELLVETALAIAPPNRPLTVVDVGTGSGCIAVSLAKHRPAARLLAVDMSTAALAVAQQNAARHGVQAQITFLPGSLLQPVDEPVDLIVSNPPYVARPVLQNRRTMPEVRRFEPRSALDGGETGLEIIEPLLAQATKKLQPGGSLLVEIGFDQGKTVWQMARHTFPTAQIAIKKDLAGLDRLLVIKN